MTEVVLALYILELQAVAGSVLQCVAVPDAVRKSLLLNGYLHTRARGGCHTRAECLI